MKQYLLWLGYNCDDFSYKIRYLDPLLSAMFKTTEYDNDKVYVVPSEHVTMIENLINSFNELMPERLNLDPDKHEFYVPFEWIVVDI